MPARSPASTASSRALENGLDRGEHGPPRNLAEAQVEKPTGDLEVLGDVVHVDILANVVVMFPLGDIYGCKCPEILI